ncbi:MULTISPECIES: hypothetical protein [Pseudomonas]|uniref:DUF7693 domain-containing protein n=1 Tax=Pseudomonas putida TaxID=303 RepID=A0A6S5D831_PSEPU|nr:hypothetical protein [Pseudomonas guariconensis]CAB5535267.1 Uncharacterised protein [Pseudomonas putida]CAB5563971.1 Uncharacterised protein [Pseudomonas putida]CAB5569318.1 Uncharacterised protein [Pseudomonas putida]CAB5612772.1 Uncharacterised protein [Pseudomonas putida]CAB5653771.1 Uncharacterised protein [Pseudomonas putida]
MLPPNSREACQRLRDAALGIHALQVLARTPEGQVDVRIDGWQLRLLLDADGLVQCSHCRTPDGHEAGLQDWHRYGTNPTDLLSIWERGRIEQLLATGISE